MKDFSSSQVQSEDAASPVPLSVVLPVRNEGWRLQPCLERLRWASEVILVDMYSTDETVSVASQFANVKVFQNDGGPLGLIRLNILFGIQQCSNDWILLTAADECVTDELREAIQEAIRRDDYEAYSITIRNYFCGRPLRFGEWEGAFVHLVRRNAIELKPQGGAHEEAHVVHGRVGALRGVMEHHSHPSIYTFVEKLNRYTTQDASLSACEGERSTAYALMAWRPMREFLRRYIRRRGYKDGAAGFVVAGLMACYVFIGEAKQWELRQRGR